MNSRRQAPAREAVIQDVETPAVRGNEFLEFFEEEIGMSPVWLCPLRLRGERRWPLYPLEPGEVYVNFGFWGTVALPEGENDGYYNRKIEDEVTALGGHKSLYSTSFYTEDEFNERYNGELYAKVKREYDPQRRLLSLYDKCVRGR
jgi:FAD/FMN-containing dehydrogenase